MGVASIADLTSEPANVLLLSPSFNSHSDAFCTDLLTAYDADRTALLLVTNTGSADESVRRWTAQGNAPPGVLGIVAMGEYTRSAATTSGQTSGASGQTSGATGLTTETIADPGDLTGVGIEITEQLEQWADGDNQIVACYDSLTVLLQYAPVEKVYQFTHVLTQQMKAAGAVAHYHMDPSAHDDETVYTLLPLFDAVIAFDADGVESVHTR